MVKLRRQPPRLDRALDFSSAEKRSS